MPKKKKPALPFHAVALRVRGKLLTYGVYLNNEPFLMSPVFRGEVGAPLKRHDAYAIAKLLNEETHSRKWAEKYEDPYVPKSAKTTRAANNDTDNDGA